MAAGGGGFNDPGNGTVSSERYINFRKAQRLTAALSLGFSLLVVGTAASAAPEEEKCNLSWQRGYSVAYWMVSGLLSEYPDNTRRGAPYVYSPDIDQITFDLQVLHFNRLANWYYLEGNAELLSIINERLSAFYRTAMSHRGSAAGKQSHRRAALNSRGPVLHVFQEYEISGKLPALERSIARLTEWQSAIRSEYRNEAAAQSFLMTSNLLLAQSLIAMGAQKNDQAKIEAGLEMLEDVRKRWKSNNRTVRSRGAITRFRIPLEHAVGRLILARAQGDYAAFEEPLKTLAQEIEDNDPDCDYVNHARAFYYLSYFEVDRAAYENDRQELERLSVTVGRRIDDYKEFPAFRRKVLDLYARVEATLNGPS